jgi:hypothetical protein
MKVTYRVHLADPQRAQERLFVRDADAWPFPNLPAPGDAVFLDVPGQPAHNIGARAVKRVVYVPQAAAALIEMHTAADQNWTMGVDDQVAALLGAGFREVN